MTEIHQKDVKALVVENWEKIQERREKFEAYKVMTDMINDIQKIKEKEDDPLDEDDGGNQEEMDENPLETTSEKELKDFDKWAKDQAKKSLKGMTQFISLESPLEFRKKICQLNDQQRKLFDDVMERETSTDVDKQPFFVYVAGAAGTGKSHLLRILVEGVKQVNVKAGNELEKPSILAMAPTANSAFIIGAKTVESALHLSGNNYSYKKLSGNQEAHLKFLYDDVSTIFCDEISMVGSGKFTKINFRMQDLADKNQRTEFMGRKNFIAGGDMWQLPPVKDRFVYEKNKLDGRPSCAPSHWTEHFTIYYLTEKVRSQTDPEFGEVCDKIARGNLDEKEIQYLQKLVRPCPSTNENENFKTGKTSIIVRTNEKRKNINREKIESLIPNEPVVVLSATDRSTNISKPPELTDDINYTNTGNLAKSLILKVGAPIILTVNHTKAKYREDGIVNSARGYVDSFQIEAGSENDVKAIWVVFQNKNIGKKLREESYDLRSSHTPNDLDAVPIEVFKVRFTLKSGDVNYQRTQFPAVLAYAVTAHKSQGSTLQEILIDFTGDKKSKSKPFICKGSFYTAITRATKGDDVYLQDFDTSYIQANKRTEEVIEAMQRFKSYPFYKVYLDDKVFKNDSLEFKIGYLNINDLTAELHAEYVNSDKNLAKLDILALADTRLGDKQTDDFLMEKLSNFQVLKRFDADDGSKHMGMLLLLSRTSSFKELIPEDLIDCFQETKEITSGRNKGNTELFLQGNIVWLKEHYMKICFMYFREKPNQRELLKAAKHWQECDIIMGDFNLKPNISADGKLLRSVCGETHTLSLNEMTTNHGQPDHIVLHKQLETKSFSTSFFNFVSDHKSIAVRIGLLNNSFDTRFLEKINFQSEKHMKKMESMKQEIKTPIDLRVDQPDAREENSVNIEKLEGSTWLDDTIINEYGKLMKEQFEQTVFVFSSHFLEQLSKHGYKGVKRWDKNVNIFEKKLVFYPLFENYHWFLAVQNNDEKTISILEPFVPLDEIIHPPKQRQFNPSLRKLRSSKLDSIIKDHQERLSIIHNQYILKHEKLPGGLTFKTMVLCAPEIPHQSNSNDCGVFLLQFMKYIAQEEHFNFSCMDMPYFRREIREEIENKVIGSITETSILQMRSYADSQPEENTAKPVQTGRKPPLNEIKQTQEAKLKTFLTEPGKGTDYKILKFSNPPRKNLCFSNAVTNALLNIPAFKEMLKADNNETLFNNKIFTELKRLFQFKNKTRSSTKTLRRIVQGECFKSGQQMRTFDNDNQHDAAEFLNSVLEHLFKHLPSTSIIKENLFGGLSQKTMFCSNANCNMSNQLQVENLSDIIPVEFSGYTLESCMEHYFSPEEIERQCENCASTSATQVTTFVKEPETLIIQLNRFTYSQNDNRVVKINEPLIFQNNIQLPSGTTYKMIATINHIGETANIGHYTCLVKDPDAANYFLVDDGSVFPSVAIGEEISEQVYLLVYAK